ncbi:uncharacterized protein LOC124535674 [Vanessa cardui]|uniref:uncharacterized protein LOC124535674 n=1 Tax=Vanessa cardui TaxID=171605 RepID=UPI001F12D2A8|nr:uncharacterized protein LOC124535674 [Vanessa cardui]
MSWKINSCCVCFPLRPGLFVWGYFAIILSYITILRMLFRIQDILEEYNHFDPLSFIELSISLGVSIIHFIFYIVFVTGLHKKSRGCLEIFYGYNVITIIGLIIIISLYLPVQAYRIHRLYSSNVWIFVVVGVFSTGITLLLQLYITIAVRSLISKLEDERDCTSSAYITEDPGCIVHGYKERNNCEC